MQCCTSAICSLVGELCRPGSVPLASQFLSLLFRVGGELILLCQYRWMEEDAGEVDGRSLHRGPWVPLIVHHFHAAAPSWAVMLDCV